MYFHIQLRIQYPPRCAAIQQCQELFRYRTLMKFSEHQTHYLSMGLNNGEKIYLGIRVEQFDGNVNENESK